MELTAMVAAGEGWELGTLLRNTATALEGWVSIAMVVVGVALLGWSLFKLVRYLMADDNNGPNRVSMVRVVLGIVVAGTLIAGGVSGGGKQGWAFWSGLSEGSKGTLENLGKNTAVAGVGDDFLTVSGL